MRFIATFKVLGILLIIFSFSMLPPVLVDTIYQDGATFPFVTSFVLTLMVGILLWAFCRRPAQELKTRDGFLVVVLFWTVLSVFGAIPFMMDPIHPLTFTDSLFETVSGLTTTGASVLSNLDKLPRAVIYYRQQLHFWGGMGVVVLAVAILPMLGVGGMQLARAEVVGPVKDAKLKPRMRETARLLWSLYLGIMVLCTTAYWIAGLSFFDALCESFSTISTGGFSIHDNSLAYHENVAVNIITIVFMLIGAINFSLHFKFLQEKKLTIYFKDVEFKGYLFFLLGSTLIVCITLLLYNYYEDTSITFLDALFTVVSLSTTTGLTVTDFSQWPTFLPYFIMIIAMIGGCSGSTSGGIKVIRCLLLRAQGVRELRQLIHPKAVFPVKLGSRVLSEDVAKAIWGFIAIFTLLFVFLLLVLLATGLDFSTAFGALAACISNAGASIGGVANNFENINWASKWVLIFSMLTGRLEIFTILVLFMPSFWRR